MPQRATDHSAATRPRLPRAFLGPVLTLAFIAVSEALHNSTLWYPNPPMPLTVLVVLSAFMGGTGPALVSAMLGVAYSFWFFSLPGAPFHYSPENFRRVPVVAIVLPLLAWLVGELRRRTDAAVERSVQAAVDERYRDILDHSADAIFIIDEAGHCEYANEVALRMTGYSRGAMGAMNLLEMLGSEGQLGNPPDAPGRDSGEPQRVDRVMTRADGTRILTEASTRSLPDGRHLGILRDVTRERGDLASLESALAQLRATLESTTDGILVVDRDGKWQTYNQRFVELWNLPSELLHDKDPRAPLAFASRQLADPEAFVARIRELYAAPEEESFEEFHLLDGRTFERYSRPQRNGNEIIGRVWSWRDATEQRSSAEALRLSERRFQEAQKLEAVGRLAGGVAHDFNNMLTAILGEAELLMRDLPPGAAMRDPIVNIHGAAARCAELTRQLLALGRRQPGAPIALRMTRLVADVETLVRRLAGPETQVYLELPADADAPCVRVDPSQLEQALLNLVINAHDAMPQGGTLRVRIRRESLEAPEVRRRGGVKPGDYAILEVSDTGHGIDDAVRPHLFEPFFTTKPPGKGTGLGLASVYATVEQSGGFMEVLSAPGEGSTFRILLPEITAAQLEPPPAKAKEESRAGCETILVAEDEAPVRTFVVGVLRQFGYTVIEAESGAHALALADAHAGDIALLLTDVLMPGMTGVELVARMRAARPGVRVLLMSGYAGEGLTGLVPGPDQPAVLAKPFALDELARRLRSLLDEPAPGA